MDDIYLYGPVEYGQKQTKQLKGEPIKGSQKNVRHQKDCNVAKYLV